MKRPTPRELFAIVREEDGEELWLGPFKWWGPWGSHVRVLKTRAGADTTARKQGGKAVRFVRVEEIRE